MATDIFLYSGESNPNNIRLRNPLLPVGVVQFSGDSSGNSTVSGLFDGVRQFSGNCAGNSTVSGTFSSGGERARIFFID